jgi:hypothetical protein
MPLAQHQFPRLPGKFFDKCTLLAGGLFMPACVPAQAATLASLIVSKGPLTAGEVVCEKFALGTSPSLCPQDATIGGGGQDIDISATVDANDQAVLHLAQINPADLTPARPSFDRAAKGAMDQLRNVIFKATVKNPAVRLVAMMQSSGAGAKASGEVTQSIFNYARVPQSAPGTPLPG